jgi:hypothetical protein
VCVSPHKFVIRRVKISGMRGGAWDTHEEMEVTLECVLKSQSVRACTGLI